MTTSVSTPSVLALYKAILFPGEGLQEVASTDSDPVWVFRRFTFWLLLMPPLFSLIGGYSFGWRLGAEQPLFLPASSLLAISLGYFLVLLFGFVSTAFISRWMSATYGASLSFGRHFTLVSLIGAPLALASSAHLFPDVFFNLLIMIPALMWSMLILYKGTGLILETSPEQGVLLASSLVGWLLVAAVSLLGTSMLLWTSGVGPFLGI